VIDRAEWLAGLRREARRRYDEQFSETYDHDDPSMDAAHRHFVEDVVAGCPAGGVVLDIPCGTGKYFDMILHAGRQVVGCDQSAGMLAKAAAKHPGIDTRQLSLQDLDFDAAFDAVICIDAMEDVPPEEWPLVIANLRRAARPGAEVYLTVEMTDEDWLNKAYDEAKARGLPVVPREDITRGDAYHHYPALTQVREWLSDAGLVLTKEAHSDGDHPSYSYQHFLTVA
jgi:cyclopropane fatty-acyl-phospholipid synthase-like methyltransferase